MFANIKYDLERLLMCSRQDSLALEDIPAMNTRLGNILKGNLYYARAEGDINWELLLSILLEFVLLFESYFVKDGKIKIPSIFKWPTIIKQMVEIIKKIVDLF